MENLFSSSSSANTASSPMASKPFSFGHSPMPSPSSTSTPTWVFTPTWPSSSSSSSSITPKFGFAQPKFEPPKTIPLFKPSPTLTTSDFKAGFNPEELRWLDSFKKSSSTTTGPNSDQGFPLTINVYPYHALSRDPENIALEYALFQKTTPTFNDQGRDYYNLFDATVDAYRATLMKALGNDNLKIIIGETGWPSAGNPPLTSVENARIYNNNLKKHVLTKGTPAKPEQLLDVYIFALFNENKKQAGFEQNFGTFYPNMRPVYHLW